MTRFALLPVLAFMAVACPRGCARDDGWIHRATFEGGGFRLDLPPELFPARANLRHIERHFPEDERRFVRRLVDAGDFTTRDLLTSVSFFGTHWDGACDRSKRSLRLWGEHMRDLDLESGRWQVRWQHDPDSVDLIRCVDDRLWRVSVRSQGGTHRGMEGLARELAERAQLSSPPPRSPLPVRRVR